MTSGWQTCRSSGEGSSDGFFHSCRGGCAFAAARRPSEQICLCCGCAGCIQVRLVVNGVALSSAYWAELFSSLSFKQRKSQKQVKKRMHSFYFSSSLVWVCRQFFPNLPWMQQKTLPCCCLLPADEPDRGSSCCFIKTLSSAYISLI